jgi:hypothetical protein
MLHERAMSDGLLARQPQFLPRYGQKVCFCFTTFRPVLVPTQPLCNAYRGLFPRWQGDRSVKLTTHVQLVPRPRKRGSIHARLVTQAQGQLYLSVFSQYPVTTGEVWRGEEIYWSLEQVVTTLCRAVSHRSVIRVTVFSVLLANGFRVHVLAGWRPFHTNLII